MNLLKFPIINPKGWRLYKRVNRLREMKEADIQEDMLRRSKQQQQQFGDMKNVILKGNPVLTYCAFNIFQNVFFFFLLFFFRLALYTEVNLQTFVII